MKSIKLPSLGEGVDKGLVVSVLVKKGDRIELEQPLLEIETDKVTIEIPADKAGIIEEILIKEGEEIITGQELMILEPENDSKKNDDVELKEDESKKEEKEEVLIGENLDKLIVDDESEALITSKQKKLKDVPQGFTGSKTENQKLIVASPLARKLAREIGVDISKVRGKAPSGRISIKDVKVHSKQLHQLYGSSPKMELPDFSIWGPIRREKCAPITEATNRNISASWSQIPHAWIQEKANITILESKRKEYKERRDFKKEKLTITAILIRVVSKVISSRFTIFNSSYDASTNELIKKDYLNIGVAVDTDRGLVVPVIKEADTKSLIQIVNELNLISQKARQRKLTNEDLRGATFTISNLGGFDTTGIFPIINFPQVAILGIATSRFEPIWQETGFYPQLMMPMTLGFDHRIINGADTARFLQALKKLLEDPDELF